jgi:dTDP-4-amino-4,6-dideoxygalactose transaminase
MRKSFLPFSPPAVGEDEIAEVVRTLRSHWITTGPRVARFEKEFCSFLGAPAAVGLSSGTAALHLALLSSGVGPGDGVITTPMTFCSTVHVIEHVGARPILADIEPDTLNIDPQKIEEVSRGDRRGALGGAKVKAILPVHLYGHPCEMDSILSLAGQNGWAVIEDAAHALPARYKGGLIGSSPNPKAATRNARLTCFSFYATKNITTGEGGMLTGDPELLEKARLLSLHGMKQDAWKRYSSEGSWYYEVVAAGFKYNLTDLAAAIGLHQLRKLPQFQERRRTIVNRYNQAFSLLPELTLPVERPEVVHAWHLYVLRLNLERLNLSRDRFIEELKSRNIGASVHFIPIHLHPYYRDRYGFSPESFPVAHGEYRRIVSLPLHPGMEERDVEDVVEAVHAVVQKFRK